MLTAGSTNTLPLEIVGMTTNVTSPVLYALGYRHHGRLIDRYHPDVAGNVGAATPPSRNARC